MRSCPTAGLLAIRERCAECLGTGSAPRQPTIRLTGTAVMPVHEDGLLQHNRFARRAASPHPRKKSRNAAATAAGSFSAGK